MLKPNTTKPVLVGRIAVYVPDIQTARRVYAAVLSEMQTRNFGTVTLDSGEEIDWVDMAGGPVLHHEGQ